MKNSKMRSEENNQFASSNMYCTTNMRLLKKKRYWDCKSNCTSSQKTDVIRASCWAVSTLLLRDRDALKKERKHLYRGN